MPPYDRTRPAIERFAWALRRPFYLLGRLKEEPVAWRAYRRTVLVQAALTLVVGSLVFILDHGEADDEVRHDIAQVSSSLRDVEQALGQLSLEVRKDAAAAATGTPRSQLDAPARAREPRGDVPPPPPPPPPGDVVAVGSPEWVPLTPPVPPVAPTPPVRVRVKVGQGVGIGPGEGSPADEALAEQAEAARDSAQKMAEAQRAVARAQRDAQRARREAQEAEQRVARAARRVAEADTEEERATRLEALEEAKEAMAAAREEAVDAEAELAEASGEVTTAAGEVEAAQRWLSKALGKAMARRREAEARRQAMSVLERASTAEVDVEAVEDARREAELLKKEALRLASELRTRRGTAGPSAPGPAVEQVAQQETALAAQASELKASLAALEARLSDVTARWWRLLGFFLSALIIAQIIVLALSRDFQDRLTRDLSLVAGVVPEDWPERLRVRLDAKWLYRKARRRARGLWVLVPSVILLSPFLAVGSIVGLSETMYSLVLGAVTGYWWLVFTAARSARGWRFEHEQTPPGPLRFAQKVVAEVPGFRWWLPRGLVHFAVRTTRMMAAPARAVEVDLPTFTALGLLRLLTTLPVLRLGMRAAILATTAEVLEGALPTQVLPPVEAPGEGPVTAVEQAPAPAPA